MVFEEFSNFKYDNNDEKFAEEFVVVYSKFLITTDFGLVRDKIAELARRGHIRSLAKYIKQTNPKDWDEDLKNMALSIKNGEHQKTPQEWEVVCAIDWHEPLQNCPYEHIKSILNLRKELMNVGAEFFDAEIALRKRKINEEKYNKIYNYGNSLMTLYERQPYFKSLQNCQEGYYSAFIEHQNVIDGVGFLEFTLNPDDLFIPYDNFKNYGNGVVYSKGEIANFLIENFNKIDKNQDCTNEELYAFAFAITLFGKNNKEKQFGIRTLNIVSKQETKQSKKLFEDGEEKSL